MLEIAQVALSSGVAFFWDKVLGDYVAGLLVMATIGLASKVYRRRRHRRAVEEE
ncbi:MULTISPECIES: hypothetical protein [Streptomyces]|uniref:hypothetical protein n=1 Tax=Streptomyces TaxID=1883 RepID=UPI00131C4509|nr:MULTISPECIES: hypothetical protein [Streptomyces]